MKFSIIIPTYNEAGNIQNCLSALQALRDRAELIVVDGGSTDGTLALAVPLADHVIPSVKGRARQMNSGARQATGDYLLFLHADTSLPDQALTLIEQGLSTGTVWGRFDVQLDGKHPMLEVIAFMMNRRSRLTGIATGDQAVFILKTAFESAGRYPEINLMEDIALSAALKKISPPLCLNAKVTSSARRWEQFGVFKTMLLMWSLRLRYFFGQDPNTLEELYRRGRFWTC